MNMCESRPLFISAILNPKEQGESLPTKWDWRLNGFYAPRGHGFAIDLISDLAVTQYVYQAVGKVSITLDSTVPRILSESGVQQLDPIDVTNYIMALCGVYKMSCRKRMPILGMINSLGYAYANLGGYDPVSEQFDRLRHVWRSTTLPIGMALECKEEMWQFVKNNTFPITLLLQAVYRPNVTNVPPVLSENKVLITCKEFPTGVSVYCQSA